MKNKVFIIMLCAVLTYFAVFIGVFIGRTGSKDLINVAPDSNITNAKQESPMINLNTTNENDLVLYLDIDRSLARSIITYRNTYGEYVYISELKNVPGMTDGDYQKIKPYLTLSD